MIDSQIFNFIIVIFYYFGIGILLSFFFRWIVHKLEIDTFLDKVFQYIKNKYNKFINN
ncbi:hypothetical protein KQI30_11580 [Clostridium bornimense]|uniref:hypothetical protein n=1 Tax=Clostridium bornimense TaxID=1216932 RepID=UPI001C11F92D|nr:hypothetical protein [Clostridium bornimense]MBU5316902.1 hypothetical protein [Clostridium bornimense]